MTRPPRDVANMAGTDERSALRPRGGIGIPPALSSRLLLRTPFPSPRISYTIPPPPTTSPFRTEAPKPDRQCRRVATDVLARGAAEGVAAEAKARRHNTSRWPREQWGGLRREVFVEVVSMTARRDQDAPGCGDFADGRIPIRCWRRDQYVGGLIGGIGMAPGMRERRRIACRANCRRQLRRLTGFIPVHADMPEFDIAMIEEEDMH